MNIYDLVKEIVRKSNDLKNKYTSEIDAKVNYACIFCKNDDEYNSYIKYLEDDGNQIIDNTYSGPLFRIKDLDTCSGTLKLLKIRKYDEKHLDLGDADFTVDDYSSFKNKYMNNDNFNVMDKDEYQMLELIEEGNDVRAYFSNPPLDEELGIK